MKFLVFQHIAIEHPGYFREIMRSRGVAWDTVEVDAGEAIPDLGAYSALLVMGGPMDVWQEDEYPWLKEEKAAIREAVRERSMPYLGVCLGHQLLADALGGQVGPMAESEVGILDVELTAEGRNDALFAGIETTCSALQWHGAQVSALPESSVLLARSQVCPIQAFRTGASAWGLQYHIELTADTVGEWGEVAEYASALESTFGADGLQTLRRDAAAHMPDFNARSATLMNNFVDVVARN